MSTLLILIVLLGVPGIVCYFIFEKFHVHYKRENWENFFRIVIYSLISYAIYYLAYFIITKHSPLFLDFIETIIIIEEKDIIEISIPWVDLLLTTLVGIFYLLYHL